MHTGGLLMILVVEAISGDPKNLSQNSTLFQQPYAERY
jgi:hypothetical protein